MRWEELTSDQFAEAVEAVQGVCVVPLSVIERHGHHLPMATDMYIGREVCNRAAAIEPAIVFPDYIFTQILEAKHCPGTIAIDADLMLKLLDNVCREIARNGLKKIILASAHGGNGHLLPFFAQAQLQSPRDYTIYVAAPHLEPAEDAALTAQWETAVDGHAGEFETSAIMAIRPDLVHADQIPANGEGMPLGRLDLLQQKGAYTGIWWYADHPTHYRGDAKPSTAQKGELFLSSQANALARVIRVVKADQETKRLQDEFYAASNHDGA